MSNELLLDRHVLVHASHGVVKDGKQLYDLDFVIEGPTENRSIGIRGYDHDLGMFVLGEKYQFVIRQVPDNHLVDLVSEPDVYSVSSISFIDEKRGAYTIEMTRVMEVDKTSYHVDLLLDNVPTNKFSGNLNDRFFVEIQPSQSALLDDFRHWTDCANHVLKQAIEKAKKPDCAKEEIAEIVDEVKRVYEVGLSKLEKTKSSSISNEVKSTNCIADTRLSLKENTIDAISDIASFKSLISLGYMVDNALTAAMEEAKKPNCTKEDIAGILDKIKGAYGAIEEFNEFHNVAKENISKELNNSIKPMFYIIDAHLPLEERISQTITALYQKHDYEETPEVFVGLFDTEGKGNKNLQVEFKYTDDRRDSLILNILLSEFQPSSGADSVIAETLFALATSWHKLQGTSGVKEISVQDMRPYGAITDNCRYMMRDFCRSVCSHLTMEEQKEIRREFLDKYPYLDLDVKEEQVLSEVITDYIGDERFVKSEEPTPMASDLSDLVRQKINRKGKQK